MQRSHPRRSVKNERWQGNSLPVDGTVFERVDFDGLVVKDALLQRLHFIDCRFKHCQIGFNVRYEACNWERCQFSTQHTAFGPNGHFHECLFSSCKIQECSVDGTIFDGCSFSGLLKNLTFRGEKSSRPEIVCKLASCDLSAAHLDNVNFTLGIKFDDVTLPTSRIRLFNNTEERLRLELLSAANLSSNKLVSSSLKFLIPSDGQDLVVLDDGFIATMLDTTESVSIFNRIASRYEINRGREA